MRHCIRMMHSSRALDACALEWCLHHAGDYDRICIYVCKWTWKYVGINNIYLCKHACEYVYVRMFMRTFLDGYCSTVQGLLDWFEVDLGFTELLFIQIDLCVLCVFVLYSPVSLSSCPFFGHAHAVCIQMSLHTRMNVFSYCNGCLCILWMSVCIQHAHVQRRGNLGSTSVDIYRYDKDVRMSLHT